MNSNPGHYVIVGRVAGVFGIKGWLKIRSETEPPANILNYSPWYLQQDGVWVAFQPAEAQRHGQGLIAHLQGCDDRDAAAALVGRDIAVTRDQLPVSTAGEYYWADLVGLKVINQSGEELGRVDHLLETGANDVLAVKGERGECLIPFVTERYIMGIDLENGVIHVDWEQDY